jgi:hypothetical protein
LEVHLTVSGCVPGANADTRIFENGWHFAWDRRDASDLPSGFLGGFSIGSDYIDSTLELVIFILLTFRKSCSGWRNIGS